MPDQQAHVFISYSRRDSQFARRVVNELGRHGRDIWVDWEDINVAEDWLQAVYNGIETSDTFIFIITRNSVMSEVCNLEIQHARLHNKRIIPIVHEPIEGTLLEEVQTFWDDTEWSEMAYKNWQTIGHLNWLFFVDSAIFSSQISNLVRVIDTDLKHIKAHTRLLVRAREWETNAQSNSFLASGDELITAETWLKATEENEKDPPPTALHKRYIEASREA
ncbi:MAG: toll/interleukin-1 receptor domain-containing protein, partial [Chloroflexota bacterium]